MPQVLVQFLLGSVTMVASMRMTSSTSCRASPPSMSLLRLALPASTVALVALNIAQNGPSQPINLGAILKRDAVPLTFEGPIDKMGDGGYLISSAFTPTDTSPRCLEEVMTLRTKADVVRAWRNGAAPELPGQAQAEVYDGMLLHRGVLAPASSFITHRLFAPFRRWRGKVFFPQGGGGCNRFGGNVPNRFGITSSAGAELERVLKQQLREQRALSDPLLRQTIAGELQQRGGEATAVATSDSVRRQQAGESGTLEAEPELRRRSFTARIEPSRLDGRPALVLDYGAQGEGKGGFWWGSLLGMRDELREVAPGVLVGLGSFRATGGVRNCAPFVLVRAE